MRFARCWRCMAATRHFSKRPPRRLRWRLSRWRWSHSPDGGSGRGSSFARSAPAGRPMLLDFGIAKFSGAGPGRTQTGLLLTPEYASPEQLRGETITTASDVFSLGVLLYLLLTERRPWAAAGGDPAGLMRAVC